MNNNKILLAPRRIFTNQARNPHLIIKPLVTMRIISTNHIRSQLVSVRWLVWFHRLNHFVEERRTK